MSIRTRMVALGLAAAALTGGVGAASFAAVSATNAATMVEYAAHARSSAPSGRAWNGKLDAAAPGATAIEYGATPGATAIEYGATPGATAIEY